MPEEWAYVLDYLPRGRPDDPTRSEPLLYLLGESHFVLLEAHARDGANALVGDRVYVGRDPTLRASSPVERIRGRVRFDQMTHSAQKELPFVATSIVKAQEPRFLKFFNEAGPLTTRMHSLELLPGLGKKLMWAIVEERKKGPFLSFQDLATRVKSLHQPEKLVAHRIELEIVDPQQKYFLFVQPFPSEEERGRFRR